MHSFLEEAFPRAHQTLRREVVGELSLLYTWEGTNPSEKPILLMSHIDVVPAENHGWTHMPFSGDVADGHVWGRGTLDIKCGAMAILEAIENLIGEGFQPKCTVYVALGHDEEVGGQNGNAKIAAMLEQQQVRLRYVLDEGGVITEGIIDGVPAPVAFVGIAEKGYYSVELSNSGPGGHSSMPRAQSSIGIIAAAVEKLESTPMPSRIDGATETLLDYLGPEMPFGRRMVLANRWLFAPLIKRNFAANPTTNGTIRTTTAVKMFQGSALPEAATARIHFRLLPGDTGEDVGRHIQDTIDDDRVKVCVHRKLRRASTVADVDSPDFNTMHQTIREVFPDVVVAPGLTVVTTDSRHYEALSDNIYRFIPTRVTPEDIQRVHGIDERIAVTNYLEIIRFFIQQIRNSTS